MLGHLRRRCAGSCQPLPGFPVQPAADAEGQVLVDGITDKIVAEPEPVTVICQDPPSDAFRQHPGQLQRGPGRRRGQVSDGKAGAQDRGRLQSLQGVAGQETETAQGGESQRRRQGHFRYLGPPSSGLDYPLLGQGRQQFGHEQRIASCSGHASEQARPRYRGHRLAHQLRHRLLGEPAQDQVP